MVENNGHNGNSQMKFVILWYVK